MNEADIKRGLVDAFNDLGDRTLAFRTETNIIGLPDISANRPPYVAWIEVKYHRPGTPNWKATPRQLLLLRKLDGFLVTYTLAKDGLKSARVEEYVGPDVDRWWEISVKTGWPKLHDKVARWIWSARLRSGCAVY